MNQQLVKESRDFAVRIIEMNRYLEKNGRHFARSDRLVACGTDIGALVYRAATLPVRERSGLYRQALGHTEECTYLFDLLKATEGLPEAQLAPIRGQCMELAGLLKRELDTGQSEKSAKIGHAI